jgi:hypothetical protein
MRPGGYSCAWAWPPIRLDALRAETQWAMVSSFLLQTAPLAPANALFELGSRVGTLNLGLAVRGFCVGTAGVSVNRARKLSTWASARQQNEQVMPWPGCYLLVLLLEGDLFDATPIVGVCRRSGRSQKMPGQGGQAVGTMALPHRR